MDPPQGRLLVRHNGQNALHQGGVKGAALRLDLLDVALDEAGQLTDALPPRHVDTGCHAVALQRNANRLASEGICQEYGAGAQAGTHVQHPRGRTDVHQSGQPGGQFEASWVK